MSGIFVFAEHNAGFPERVTLELLGEARRLAREIKSQVSAVVFGDRVSALSTSFAHYGADVVYVFEDDRLRYYDPRLVVPNLGRLIEAESPLVVLLPATTSGSDVAVRLAMEHNWPLASRSMYVRLKDGALELVRPLANGAVHASFRPARNGPSLVTIPPDVIGVDAADSNRTARVIVGELVSSKTVQVEVGDYINSDPSKLDVREAEIIVSAGRGVGSRENMKAVEELADALGGSVGGTRVVVDLGWLPKERQIGVTGKTVTPRLYVACGISGATQHTIGMKDASTIIAINNDAAAPIFKIAHLAVQADVHTVLSALTARCRQYKKGAA
jgi:electron transfer flavoprotein alpha subunit